MPNRKNFDPDKKWGGRRDFQNSPRIPPQTKLILKLATRQFTLNVEPLEGGTLGGVAIFISPAPRGLSLTTLTTGELDALEMFFMRAFAEARPICEDLDDQATRAANVGDRTFKRLYRPEPIIIDLFEVQTIPDPEPQEEQPDADSRQPPEVPENL